ncbi:MAG: hypothetical protein IAE77_25690 [Prosthecobacter sp.]|jgi:hypothetical protein|uniref:hypothetical protein n=1 Tax=Prosthecobacter sp. TaxID=1965333 RepID=UPI001A0BDB82|nr:hypothetical protein [Prosthecobacter sp.]MBE2286875.1 hypothetical protein [Prosthecobacter sp.]
MIPFFLFVLFAFVACLLAQVAAKPQRIFEYPYFMAAVYAVFVLPQAYSLANFPGGVGSDDVQDVLLMCILCLAAAVFGYSLRPSESTDKLFSRPVDPSRLLTMGVGLIVVGVVSTILMPKAEIQIAERGGLTGALTIYMFFGSLTLPGFAICVRLLREKFTKGRLAAVLLGAYVPISAIVFGGRREVAVTFALSLVLSSFYKNRKVPSRIVIFGALFFAMIAIPATGTYRGLVGQGRMDMVTKIRPIDNFVDFFTQESVLELRNAAALINSTRIRDTFGWGAAYWNQLVFRFVPAQIVGRDVKDALMIGKTSSRHLYITELVNNYEISAGSTNTGMGDSYEQFGWFGCLFFAVLGMFFKSIWTSTLSHDAVFLQVFYIMVCSSAMRTITHQTVDFLPGMVYQMIFLGGCYVYAKIPERDLLLRGQVRGSAQGRRPVQFRGRGLRR